MDFYDDLLNQHLNIKEPVGEEPRKKGWRNYSPTSARRDGSLGSLFPLGTFCQEHAAATERRWPMYHH